MFLPTSMSVKVRTHGTTKISSHIFPRPGKHLLRLVSYLLVHIDTMANKNKKFPTLVQKFYFQKIFIHKHSPLQNTPVFQICYRSLTEEIYNSVWSAGLRHENENNGSLTLVSKIFISKILYTIIPITEHASVPDMLPLTHKRNLQFRFSQGCVMKL